jgi:hypothetical protein
VLCSKLQPSVLPLLLSAACQCQPQLLIWVLCWAVPAGSCTPCCLSGAVAIRSGGCQQGLCRASTGLDNLKRMILSALNRCRAGPLPAPVGPLSKFRNLSHKVKGCGVKFLVSFYFKGSKPGISIYALIAYMTDTVRIIAPYSRSMKVLRTLFFQHIMKLHTFKPIE